MSELSGRCWTCKHRKEMAGREFSLCTRIKGTQDVMPNFDETPESNYKLADESDIFRDPVLAFDDPLNMMSAYVLVKPEFGCVLWEPKQCPEQ